MSELYVKVLCLGYVNTNCYIVGDSSVGEVFVIDPADRADIIFSELQKSKMHVKAILLTHGHFDHIMGAAELAALTGARICIHENEAELAGDMNMNASVQFGMEAAVEADMLLRTGDILSVGNPDEFSFEVLATPGHTSGGVSYYCRKQKAVFVGDTLFFESAGRTDLPTGNERALVNSIQNVLFVLPDETKVYCGHGPATSIGYEKENNPYAG